MKKKKNVSKKNNKAYPVSCKLKDTTNEYTVRNVTISTNVMMVNMTKIPGLLILSQYSLKVLKTKKGAGTI